MPSLLRERKRVFIAVPKFLSQYFESCWCSPHHSDGPKPNPHQPKHVCLVSNKYVAVGTRCCSGCCTRCTSYLSPGWLFSCKLIAFKLNILTYFMLINLNVKLGVCSFPLPDHPPTLINCSRPFSLSPIAVVFPSSLQLQHSLPAREVISVQNNCFSQVCSQLPCHIFKL